MLVAPWLEQSQTARHDRERILRLLAAEADGRQPTGLRAARDPAGQLTITQRWALVGT